MNDITPGIGHNQPPLPERLAADYSHFDGEIEQVAEKANAAPLKITNDDELGKTGDIARAARALSKRIDNDRKSEKEPYLSANKTIEAFFKEKTDRLTMMFVTLEKRATEYQKEKAAEAKRRADAEARKAQEEAERQRRIAEKEAERNRPTGAASHADKAEALEDKAAAAAAIAESSAANLTRHRTESGVVTAQTKFTFEITDLPNVDLEKLRPYIAKADIEKAVRAFVRVNKDSIPLAGVRIFADIKASFR